MEYIFDVLPDSIKEHVLRFSPSDLKDIEEIRIRIGRPLEVTADERVWFPSNYIVQKVDGVYLLNKLSQYSIYAIEEELKQGYITITGGHRVGLAGKVITEGGRVKAIKNVTSFNIRIARQKIGVANNIIPYIYNQSWLNTIIIGPPQSGKTTILRDIARIISSGDKSKDILSRKVSIVDERSEIAGCINGIPQHELGKRIDVLDACPKAEGMMMMIRSMSPDVLIVDEIGRKEDMEAVMEAIHAGVSIIVTAHGKEMKDLQNRPSINPLLEKKVFDRIIELSRENGAGTVKRVCNNLGEDITKKMRVCLS